MERTCAYCPAAPTRSEYGVPTCDADLWRIHAAAVLLRVLIAPVFLWRWLRDR